MKVQHLFKQLFRTEIEQRGYELFRKQKVYDINRHDHYVSAKVKGTHEYEVTIFFDANDDTRIVDMECDCPYAQSGFTCKHMAAVLYQLDALHTLSGKENLVYKNRIQQIFASYCNSQGRIMPKHLASFREYVLEILILCFDDANKPNKEWFFNILKVCNILEKQSYLTSNNRAYLMLFQEFAQELLERKQDCTEEIRPMLWHALQNSNRYEFAKIYLQVLMQEDIQFPQSYLALLEKQDAQANSAILFPYIMHEIKLCEMEPQEVYDTFYKYLCYEGFAEGILEFFVQQKKTDLFCKTLKLCKEKMDANDYHKRLQKWVDTYVFLIKDKVAAWNVLEKKIHEDKPIDIYWIQQYRTLFTLEEWEEEKKKVYAECAKQNDTYTYVSILYRMDAYNEILDTLLCDENVNCLQALPTEICDILKRYDEEMYFVIFYRDLVHILKHTQNKKVIQEKIDAFEHECSLYYGVFTVRKEICWMLQKLADENPILNEVKESYDKALNDYLYRSTKVLKKKEYGIVDDTNDWLDDLYGDDFYDDDDDDDDDWEDAW